MQALVEDIKRYPDTSQPQVMTCETAGIAKSLMSIEAAKDVQGGFLEIIDASNKARKYKLV